MTAQIPAAAVLIPIFNDWEAVRLTLGLLDQALSASGRTASVLVVDDASTDPMPADWPGTDYAAIESLDVLNLRCNVGHQRAIALGLYHICESTEVQAVVIMDGDGEDRPRDVPVLLDAFDESAGRDVVFAARMKRMEGLGFRIFYQLYRQVHLILTGSEVRVGNFSVAPRNALNRLMAAPDLWNHYAAAVSRARLTRRMVPLPRGERLAGKSKMNFVSLLMHGLSSMAVFSDQVSGRLLTASVIFTAAALSFIAVILGLAVFTAGPLPTWTTYAAGVLAGLALQSLTFAILFAFLIQHSRNSPRFVPLRDSAYYILSKSTIRVSQHTR